MMHVIAYFLLVQHFFFFCLLLKHANCGSALYKLSTNHLIEKHKQKLKLMHFD